MRDSNQFTVARYAPIAPWLLLGMFGSVASIPQVQLPELAIALWALLLDGPHIWATLLGLRTTNGESAATNRNWIAVTAVLGIASVLMFWNPSFLDVDAKDFYSNYFLQFFFLVSYLHISAQHIGFFKLIPSRWEGFSRRVPEWTVRLFKMAIWLPLLCRVFILNNSQGLPLPNLQIAPLAIQRSEVAMALIAVFMICLFYFLWLLKGRSIGLAHFLYILLIPPIHTFVLLNPISPFECLVLLTLSHNLQYLDFVYKFAIHKGEDRRRQTKFLAFYFFISIAMGALFLNSSLHEAGVHKAMTHFSTKSHPLANALISMFSAIAFLIPLCHYVIDSQIWKPRRRLDLKAFLSHPD